MLRNCEMNSKTHWQREKGKHEARKRQNRNKNTEKRAKAKATKKKCLNSKMCFTCTSHNFHSSLVLLYAGTRTPIEMK